MMRLADLAYPEGLKNAERRLHPSAKVGVALSGGGIRSATFALGVFQALSGLGLLRRIDYLSTVSGGGYFGAFLGRLFARAYVRGAGDVESILAGPHPLNPDRPNTLAQARWKVLGWLRENGRYLAPRGSGDLLVGATSLLRSWVSVHVVLGTCVFALFLLVQTPRFLPGGALHLAWAAVRDRLPSTPWMWWSPWLLPSIALLALAVPVAWGYWLIPGERARGTKGFGGFGWIFFTAWTGVVVAVAVGIAAGVGLARLHEPDATIAITRRTGISIGVMAALAALAWFVADRWSLRTIPGADASQRLSREARTKRRMTQALSTVLVSAGAVAALALLDSAAQTIYATAQFHSVSLNKLAGSLVVLFATASGIARQVVVLIGSKSENKRPRLPLSMLATAIAIMLSFLILTGFDVLAHAVVWNFQPPSLSADILPMSASGAVTLSAPSSQTIAMTSTPGASDSRPSGGRRTPRRVLTLWIAGAFVLALAFGSTFRFLNDSSHQALYSARLTRAYLGASNRKRWHSSVQPAPVIDPIDGDDIGIHDYWPPPGTADGTVYAKGMPLHLINVTVNETVDGQSQVEQRDRKGVGMAIGPAGMSVGIKHHVVVRRDKMREEHGGGTRVVVDRVYPEGDDFRVFEYNDPATPERDETKLVAFPWDPLSLGRWVGISGAAFSTGTGYRTSFGLSLLAGLTNVRLGHWWDSNVRPDWRRNVTGRRRWITPFTATFSGLFRVQRSLFAEFLARFPGTAGRYWYLSDGGHFENMGGYELVRRRLPFIVVIDAEADPDYSFEGLSNLVRKARLDFQTEITFLDEVQLATYDLGLLANDGSPTARQRRFGSLERIKATASARCALARVRYPSDDPTLCAPASAPDSWLLYIKPTLAGDEPIDVRQYAQANRSFPQQTTADQFFDEAQWESYRKLGQHIGCQIFGDPPASISELSEFAKPPATTMDVTSNPEDPLPISG